MIILIFMHWSGCLESQIDIGVLASQLNAIVPPVTIFVNYIIISCDFTQLTI